MLSARATAVSESTPSGLHTKRWSFCRNTIGSVSGFHFSATEFSGRNAAAINKRERNISACFLITFCNISFCKQNYIEIDYLTRKAVKIWRK